MIFKNLRLTITAALLLCTIAASGQKRETFKYKWDVVPMDDRWSVITDSTATKLIASYDSILSPLYEVVGRTDKKYSKHRPESELSNFVVDAIRTKAEKLDGRHVNVALTNFGGIRTSLPEGEVTMYDMLSIFPFYNYLIVFEISGEDYIKLMEDHVAKPEVMSGVKMVIENGKIVTLEIEGEPVKAGRMYTMASINFLMTGGDNWCLNNYALKVREYEDCLIRDAIVEALKEGSADGKTVSLKKDGRTIIK